MSYLQSQLISLFLKIKGGYRELCDLTIKLHSRNETVHHWVSEKSAISLSMVSSAQGGATHQDVKFSCFSWTFADWAFSLLFPYFVFNSIVPWHLHIFCIDTHSYACLCTKHSHIHWNVHTHTHTHIPLSFSAISVELYYIFATVWGREAYTLYGILLVVFVILISVTACISVALTYFQLSTEDYRWWWRSIFSSGWARVGQCGPLRRGYHEQYNYDSLE